jgi:hypothetical protein
MAACEYRQAARSDSSGPDSGSVRKRIRDRSYEDLSRMKGNFHVRFLGECGRGNPPALTRRAGARRVASRGLKPSGQCSQTWESQSGQGARIG